MRLKEKVMTGVAMANVGAATLMTSGVFASTAGSKKAGNYVNSADADGGGGGDLMDWINTIVNVALGVIGVVAVVMIIVGGIQYTTSSGDAGKVKKARDTIMYGVIGLVVALLAFAIVNFILSDIFGN